MRISSTGRGGLDDVEIKRHEIFNVHPASGIGSVAVVEHLIVNFVHRADKHGHEGAPGLYRALAFAVDVRRAHDGNVDLVAVLGHGLVEKHLRVAMQCVIRNTRDRLSIVNVRPNLGVQLAQIRLGAKVREDAAAGEVEEKARSLAGQQA